MVLTVIPARVVWVADDGTGDFLLLSKALFSIIDASASNPYVVKIAPGVYTETSTVVLKSYVDVEGSGQEVTTITCECGSQDDPGQTAATVSAHSVGPAEIRHITINNTGGDPNSIGVHILSGGNREVSMLHVTATATGGDVWNFGVYILESSPAMTDVTATATATGGTHSFGVRNEGVWDGHSLPSMNNVTATATGGDYNYGVWNGQSSPSMNNVTATATASAGTSYGVYNSESSSPSIRNSSITGTSQNNKSYSIYNQSPASAFVADTMLEGPAIRGDGLTCVGAYTELFVALDLVCDPLPLP
ncbi:pectinesterase family protein [Acidimicrobiales bacterium]|jgi:hypothetical protein|nr:pectinesterase family protein [Acidimicrobiales bacterium]